MSQPSASDRDQIIVEACEVNLRLDKLLALRYPELSRAVFEKLIESNLVLINGECVKKRYLVQEGDEIEIEFQLTQELSLEAENIPLNILYEDDHILAINKPANFVVHPAVGHFSGTFANALLYHCRGAFADIDLSATVRPGIVHRLDKDTTGVLVAAKTEMAHRRLVAAFASRTLEKEYLAITLGNPVSASFGSERLVRSSIGRHPVHRKLMKVVETGGKEAETLLKTLRFDGTFAVVRCLPKTGRTHQLRVHLQALGTPILGDPLYGSANRNQKYKVTRPLLHALRLSFNHPISGERLDIVAPLPEDMKFWYDKIM